MQVFLLLCAFGARAKGTFVVFKAFNISISDTPPPANTGPLPYPFTDQSYGPPMYNPDGGLRLSNPSNIKTDVQYNPQTGKYDIYQKMGDLDYRVPMDMDSDEYEDYMFKQAEKTYFKQKTNATSLTKQQQKGLIPPIHIGGKAFEMIFGSNTVNIRPQGSAELTFGFNNSKILNPALPVAQRSLTTFNFDENIQLNVVGEIGDKLKLTTNYNTKATFDFQNQMKLGYTGHEDDIIKSIDAGNINFPLPGTLITGSQSLFGVKTKLQFGRLTSTIAYAQEKGEKKTITVQNGSQTSNFNIKVDQYQANEHYFMSMFFEQNYDSALAHLPIVNTTVNITKVEVWVTNTTTQTQNTRDIIAYSDLGESGPNLTEQSPSFTPVRINPIYNKNSFYPPTDTLNSLDPAQQVQANPNILNPVSSVGVLQSEGFQPVTDFEKIDLARMLNPSEYTLNTKLGYITLKQPLNYDQVLAVAYQYTYKGKVYQVGQFSTDGVAPGNELMVKMLKSTNVSPKVPIWKLMMKNIYSLGSYQINSQNFLLNIWYSNPATGVDIPYFPGGHLNRELLVDVLKLDQLDQQGDRVPDGLFDFLPGVTIDAANGLVIFPTVEPFGNSMAATLTKAGDASLTPTLVFQALYDSVLVIAQQEPNLDRYYIRGSFQSSASSDISLNALNIPQGSVLVTAGGIKLTENVDYSVDYTLGRVKILNQGLLSSGTPIQISLENNALFSIQSKTFAGAHFDYMVSKNFNLGATVVNYTEHPLTQIVSIGQEPVSNTMIGLNEDFKTEAPWLTRAIDALPMIHTKAPSEITASTEAAAMLPGHPKYIGSTGNAYIDDFEGSESFIDISTPFSWSLASVPQLQPSEFPEAQYNDTMAGFNRAKMTWYVVDPLFQQQTNGVTPANIDATAQSNNYTRLVLQTELFPQEQSPTGTPINLPVLNVGFYPGLKGPYNYDVNPTRISSGIDQNGYLQKPITRWGGIMRPIQETDFETDNIGFIEFWMMDPWNADLKGTANSTGTLYFDLGDVSEDVLKDGLKSFENGLPTNPSDMNSPGNVNNPYTKTGWGRVPLNPSLVNAFNNDPTTRTFQDVGLDGLYDTSEVTFFSAYLNAIKTLYGASSVAYTKALADPSNDDYNYYRDDNYDAADSGVIGRYMKYNGLEGNSPTQSQYGNKNPSGGNYPTTASTLPNTEDINQDNTLSTDETYYEYSVQMTPNNVHNNVGNNYITNSYSTSVTTPDGKTKPITWYQFKIPISDYIRKVGPISDFKSIRFMRMYFKGFDQPILLRFAKLELVRDDWRKFSGSLLQPGDYIPNDNLTTFDMYGVNLEENASRTPVSYVIPPGIQRQLNLQSANLVQQNEQSLALHICDLPDGDARAVYKNVQLDMRAYKKLQMFVHCESGDPAHPLKTGDVQAFIRIGSDFVNNYYEYAVPCQVTPAGSYSSTNATDQSTVWPSANDMVISLTTLENAKLARDLAMLNNPGTTGLQIPFSVNDGANIVTVVGNPTISNTQVIMLGVRNPKRIPATAETDDGQKKCTEVWFDELRMTDFSEKGGVAAISRVTAKLADLGSLSLSGKVSTPGFGSLETKVSDLSRETDLGFDVATNLEMGKFLPQNWNVSVPMYLGFSKQIIIPEYNPLDPDILMSQELGVLNAHQRDSLNQRVLSTVTRQSLNFTNVHKNKGKNSKKSHLYDIENFSGTYTYSELSKTDVNTAKNLTKNYTGLLTYAYSFHPKNIQPLGKSDFFKKRKYLSLIGDFNFYPYPDKFTTTTSITRQYTEFQLQNTIPGFGDLQMPVSVGKTFNMVRTFNLAFPISKSLKFDYMATNDNRVLEPEGRPISKPSDKDSVWNAFLDKERTTDFKQSLNASYEVPINKLPGLDFVSLSAHYTGTFEWVHAPFAADSLGATIQNSGVKSINGQLNMTMLYNKIGFLKKLLQNNNGNNQPSGPALASKNNPLQKLTQQNPNKNGKDSLKSKNTNVVGRYFAYMITAVKNVSVNYTDNRGSILPGFNSTPNGLGMNESSLTNTSLWAPTPGVAFGQPIDTNIVRQKNWLVSLRTPLLSPFTTTSTQTLNAHLTLEPIPDLKIDVTASRTKSLSTSQYFYDSLGTYKNSAFTETGNFSMSFWSLKTIFASNASGSAGTSSLFQNYLDDRVIISARLAGQNTGLGYTHSTFVSAAPDGRIYYNGYSGIAQNVVIPAFIAAYSGQSPNKVSLNPFPAIPYPNWNATYSGLSKIKWVKKHLQSVTLSSAYSSTYTVGGYNYNLLLTNPNQVDNEYIRDINGDFLPRDQIPTVSISDQLSPLIKINVAFKNNVSSNFEVKTDRQIALNMSDLTINEIHGTNYVLGLGYKIKNVLFPIKIGGKAIRNDMNIRADFSLRESETIIRNTENLSNQITGGQSILSIKSQIEYMINTRLTLRLYFDKIINTPYISSSYPTSTMDGGLAIRFSLS
jgi:cell surface protein SprA